MPIYEYRNIKTGKHFECYVPVADRDKPCVPGVERISVPQTLNVVGLAAPVTQETETIEGFRALEDDATEVRKFEAESGYTMKECAEIWRGEQETIEPLEV